MPQAVRVEGLAEFRRDLRAIDKNLPRELNKAQRKALEKTAKKAGRIAPRKSGSLAKSVKPFATARGAGLRSRLPYANVQHWGGTTGRGHERGPNRGSVRVKPTFFAFKAVREDLDDITEAMGDAVEGLARRFGFNDRGRF